MRTVIKHRHHQCYKQCCECNKVIEFIVHCLVLLCLLCYNIGSVSVIQREGPTKATRSAIEETKESKYPKFAYSKDWDANTGYLLAKIAMAEAEGCSTETKEFVILTVLNRVWSDGFPDTVEGVIFQKVSGVAQFTPTIDGRWDRVEPNADCWTALRNVETAIYDKSQGCTFFESCANIDNWHSKNLTLLFESDGIRFYKVP